MKFFSLPSKLIGARLTFYIYNTFNCPPSLNNIHPNLNFDIISDNDLDTSTVNIIQSNLDISGMSDVISTPDIIKLRNLKTKLKESSIDISLDDDEILSPPKKKLTPGKGQKLAIQKFEKLKRKCNIL